MADTTRSTSEAAISEQIPVIDNSETEEFAVTAELGEELELEELIIEDFTIDGICGVY